MDELESPDRLHARSEACEVTITRIEINNIKGIAFCELKLAGRALTVLKGQNASGKTSILDAISSVFQGGSDPDLIRKGEKSGKVVIELSDGHVIRKIQTASGARLEVITAEGEKEPGGPMEFVSKLAKSFSFDPLAFCRAPKKERVEFLLRAMPLEFTGAEMRGLKLGQIPVGGPLESLVGSDSKLNLPEFDKIRATVYDRRRTANVSVKDLDAAVASLRRSLPAEGQQTNWSAVLKEEQAKLDKAGKMRDEEMAAILAEAQRAKDAAREAYDAEIQTINGQVQEANAAVVSEYEKAVAPHQQRVGEAQANLKRSGEVEGLSRHLEEQRDKLAAKSEEADSLDRALTCLDALRAAKLDTLPIAGLEIRDGEVYRDGIPFDHVNQQRQYITSFEVAALQFGDLPFIVADEFEHLDAEQQKGFAEWLEGSEVQVIVACVDNGPLRAEPKEAMKV